MVCLIGAATERRRSDMYRKRMFRSLNHDDQIQVEALASQTVFVLRYEVLQRSTSRKATVLRASDNSVSGPNSRSTQLPMSEWVPLDSTGRASLIPNVPGGIRWPCRINW